jgi:predicted nucleic acid-binding protein
LIFADSSYLIAIADQRDQWHPRARELAEETDDDLLVTDLVLSESVTAVGARGGGKAGMALYDFIMDSCEMVFATPYLLDRSMDIYLRHDGTLSVADALTVQVMKNKRVKEILSFDSDFDKVKGIKRIG